MRLIDNLSDTIQKNINKLKEFDKEVKSVRDQLQKVAKDKYEIAIDTTGKKKIEKDIQDIMANGKEIENPIWLHIYLNERDAIKQVNEFKRNLDEFTSNANDLYIQIKSDADKKIKTISGKISSLKSNALVVNIRDKATQQAALVRKKINLLYSYIKAPVMVINDKATVQIAKVKKYYKLIKDMIIEPIAFKVIDKASKTISAVDKKFKIVKRVVNPILKLKDMASEAVKNVYERLKNVHKSKAKPEVAVKNNATKELSKVSNMLKGLGKGAKIGLNVVGNAATALLGNALKGGTQLEQQQMSIEHFVGANNKGKSQDQIKTMSDDYITQLKNNANLTPFTSNDVMSAGAKAINITGGDTGAAMDMLKVAEDMAALNPEKSLGDAMEALAAMKNGQADGMKAFGFNISDEDIKKSGGTDAVIKNQLAPFFSGGAEKMAASTSGLVSTIKDRIGSALADTGMAMLEKAKPLLEMMVGLTNMLAPKLQGIGEKIAEGLGVGVQWILNLLNKSGGITPLFSSIGATIKGVFNGITPIITTLWQSAQRIFPVLGNTILSAFTSAMPIIGVFKNIIVAAIPIVENIIRIFCGVVNTLMPVVSQIFKDVGDKVGEIITFIGSKMGFIQEVINFAVPLIKDILSAAWSIISPILDLMITAFEAVWNTVEFCFPAIQGILETVWAVLEPIFGAIAEAMEWVGDAVDSIVGWFGDVFSGVFNSGTSGSTKNSSGAGGSTANGVTRAMGVNRVPYNNYLIRAHEGEMLLTKREANTYIAQTRGVQFSNGAVAAGNTANSTTFNAREGEKHLPIPETKQDYRPLKIDKFVGIEHATITNEADEDRLVEKMVNKLYRIAEITV